MGQLEGIRITRRIRVGPEERKSADNILVFAVSAGLLLCAGLFLGRHLAKEPPQHFWEYGDEYFGAVVGEEPELTDGTAPLPPIVVDPAEWYGFLREHPELPCEFLKIKPNRNGVVFVAGPDWALLTQLTGGLPETLAPDAFDEKWNFFQMKLEE